MYKLRIWLSLALIIVLVAVAPVAAQTSAFQKLVTRTLTVLSDAEVRGNVTTAGNVVVTGAVSSATLNTTGAETVGTFRLDTKAVTITVTSGGTVTPAGSYQPLTSASNVGTSAIAGCAAGTVGETVDLVNGGANTITFTDTGTLKLSSNAALGPTDVLGLRCDGTNWVQRFKSDN